MRAAMMISANRDLVLVRKVETRREGVDLYLEPGVAAAVAREQAHGLQARQRHAGHAGEPLRRGGHGVQGRAAHDARGPVRRRLGDGAAAGSRVTAVDEKQ